MEDLQPINGYRIQGQALYALYIMASSLSEKHFSNLRRKPSLFAAFFVYSNQQKFVNYAGIIEFSTNNRQTEGHASAELNTRKLCPFYKSILYHSNTTTTKSSYFLSTSDVKCNLVKAT